MTADPSAEILRLRATVRDLLALSTIPEAWVGREPPAIAAELADLLIESMQLDFAFVRLCDPAGGKAIEVTRGDSWKAFPEWLQRRLAASRQISTKEIVSKIGGVDESCCGIVIPIGVNGARGLVAAASNRSDFPDQIDQQLLSVAANNAAIAFQNACLINELRSAQEALRRNEQELRKARDELEIKVAERTNELMRTAEALRESQTELAHVNRVTTMGELTASISHEVMQPIASATTNAQAALRFLDSQPPDLEEVREALGCVVDDGNRASDIIRRIRALFKKAPPRKDALDVNAAILGVITLIHGEAVKYAVSVQTQLADGLPLIHADRVQLQQVILNLIVNALEAMSGVSEGSRELLISSGRDAAGSVLVDVQDSGPGLTPEGFDHLFDAFYTTKTGGTGMGLSICRSIVEQHGGRIWPSPKAGRGASILFTLPVEGSPQEAA